MEIVLDNVTTKLVKKENMFTCVNYTFKEDCITFCYGIRGNFLKELLFSKKIKLTGEIYLVPDGEIKDVGYISNNPIKQFKKKKVLDEFNYINEEYKLGYELVLERAKKALTMVDLDEQYLDRNFTSLSLSELKLIEISLVLFYNPKLLILDYFEKGLNYKDIDYIKKILKILKVKYKKNIIIISDDLEKYMDILDRYVIFDKGVLVLEGTNKDLYDQDIYKYLECPRIISFIKKVKDNNIDLSNYIEIKELIKAIYRDVESK